MRAELSCRAEAAPGRVLCELKYSAAPGARLVWADALVTVAPEFVRPLRSRITPEHFAQTNASEQKLSLAFVAAKEEQGLDKQVTVRARAVVCRGERGPRSGAARRATTRTPKSASVAERYSTFGGA